MIWYVPQTDCFLVDDGIIIISIRYFPSRYDTEFYRLNHKLSIPPHKPDGKINKFVRTASADINFPQTAAASPILGIWRQGRCETTHGRKIYDDQGVFIYSLRLNFRTDRGCVT